MVSHQAAKVVAIAVVPVVHTNWSAVHAIVVAVVIAVQLVENVA